MIAIAMDTLVFIVCIMDNYSYIASYLASYTNVLTSIVMYGLAIVTHSSYILHIAYYIYI